MRFFLPGLCWVCVGGGFALVGARSVLRSMRLSRKGARARATVVEYQSDEEGTSRPVVEFVDRLGAMQRVRLSAIMRPGDGGPPVGGALGVLYDPDDPGCVLVESFTHLWRSWGWEGCSSSLGCSPGQGRSRSSEPREDPDHS
jgi:hypothetical protein